MGTESEENFLEEEKSQDEVVVDTPEEDTHIEDEPSADEGEEPAEPKADEPPAYQPKFIYKVLREEKEIPEKFRGLVTDEASEKEIRDLFEKSEGLDLVKSHRDQLQSTIEEFSKDYLPFIQNANAALELKEKGDLRGFFEKVGLSDEQIFRYTKAQLDLRKDPAVFQASERARNESIRVQELEFRNAQLMSNFNEMAVRQRTFELENSLSRPEIREAVGDFDRRFGSPGAFRNECIRVAQAAAAQGKDPSAEEVTDFVYSNFKKLTGWAPGQNTQTPQAVASSSGPRTVPRDKKTLPNISGVASSPAKRTFKTLDDIKAYAKELEAQENN